MNVPVIPAAPEARAGIQEHVSRWFWVLRRTASLRYALCRAWDDRTI
jgi:hypothetical protein